MQTTCQENTDATAPVQNADSKDLVITDCSLFKMGTELYPPNPTHDEFYKKLFEFEENYTEVEDKGFIFTSEELEKLEAQVKEVKKAKNTFENSTVGSRHVKYADVYLRTVQIGFMLEKLRRIHYEVILLILISK